MPEYGGLSLVQIYIRMLDKPHTNAVHLLLSLVCIFFAGKVATWLQEVKQLKSSVYAVPLHLKRQWARMYRCKYSDYQLRGSIFGHVSPLALTGTQRLKPSSSSYLLFPPLLSW